MDVQVGDVWEVTDGVTDIVTVHAIIGDEAVCSYLRYSYTCSAIIGINSLITNKLISCMVDGKRVERPGAGEKCDLDMCLLFGIGTEDEWIACDGEEVCGILYLSISHVTLDANGELPKPEPKAEEKGYVDVVPYADERTIVITYNGVTRSLSSVSSMIGFMGFIWEEGGVERAANFCVAWRSEDGVLGFGESEGETIEHCKAVRFSTKEEEGGLKFLRQFCARHEIDKDRRFDTVDQIIKELKGYEWDINYLTKKDEEILKKYGVDILTHRKEEESDDA